MARKFGGWVLAAGMIWGAVTLAPAIAWADRLIVQRGDALYLLEDTGKEAPRRLFAVGKPGETLWAASPDGRRIAWVTRTGEGAAAPAPSGEPGARPLLGLTARAAVVQVSDLSGRHEKRLYATDTLRDRLNRRVSQVDPTDPAAGSPPDTSLTAFDSWEPVSVSWSADGRTLYLSCLTTAPTGGKATFAADAASGAALVNAEGNWKSIAPVTYLDAHEGILVGSGLARFTVSSEPDTPQRYAPVLVIDLTQGTRTPLYAASGTSRDLPDYALATECALSPEGRTVAFIAANRGLWIVDRRTHVYRRLVEGAATRPRWSRDGKSLRFLMPRAAAPGAAADVPVYDLYEMAVPPEPLTGAPNTALVAPSPPMHLLLQGVDAFDVIPDA